MDPNQLLQKYMVWLDGDDDDDNNDNDQHHRLLFKRRCIVCAITSMIGAMIGSSSSKKKKPPSLGSRSSSSSSSFIEYWLEVLSFTIQGGLVAGPLSYYVYVFRSVLFIIDIVLFCATSNLLFAFLFFLYC